METYNDFVQWERTSNDTVDLKKIYIDLTGDLISGLLLSQIIYWHLPSKQGKSKLRVHKQEKYWLAKQRTDWWDEIRITAKQYDRAIKRIEELNLVETWNTMFNGKRTPHIHLNIEKLIELLNQQLQSKEPPRFLPLGNTGIDSLVTPITETTSESTEKNNNGFHSGEIKTFAFSFLDYREKCLEEEIAPDIILAVEYYLMAYEEYMGQVHPNLKIEQWEQVIENIMVGRGRYHDFDFDLGNLEDIIDKHFLTEYKNCDFNILHFISGEITTNRYYEVAYGQG